MRQYKNKLFFGQLQIVVTHHFSIIVNLLVSKTLEHCKTQPFLYLNKNKNSKTEVVFLVSPFVSGLNLPK